MATTPPRARSTAAAAASPVPADRTARLVTLAGVAALCVFVFLQLRPDLIFADTTPTGADMAGQFWGPDFLRGHVWDQGLLAGWTPSWFGGFPGFRFYPPLPALGAALLGTVLPATIALKLLVASAVIAMPVAAWFVGRAARLTFPGPLLVSTASVVFLFDNSQHSYGGNLASSVVGEYAYGASLVLCLLTFAVFARDLERGRTGPAAALLGAATAVSHPVGAVFLLIGLPAQVLVRPKEERRAAVVHGAVTLVLIGLVSAFWYLPLWSYQLYTNELAFNRQTDFAGLLFPFNPLVELAVAALLVVGVVDAIRNRRTVLLGLVVTAIVCAIGVLLLPRGFLANVRVAPMWNIGRLLVAGAGAGVALRALVGAVPRERKQLAAIGAPVASVALVLAGIAWVTGTLPLGTATTSERGEWSITTDYRWIVGPSHTVNIYSQYQNLSFGGEERGPFAEEYQQLVSTLEGIASEEGCGRVAYENDPTGRYGSVYSLTLLPLLTDDCLTTVTGLYTDSSPTSSFAMVAESAWSPAPLRYKPDLPYESPDLDRGVAYLRTLGARYFLAITPEVAAQAQVTDGLRELDTVGDWTVFEVEDTALVVPLTATPTVLADGGSDRAAWEAAALEWFGQADPEAPTLAADGPAEWPRADRAPAPGEGETLPRAEVSDVVDDGSSISFTTSEPGVPVLIRASYFPTWTAEGAEGPWRVAPNWMVVVPTAEQVTLTTSAGAPDLAGAGLTAIGLLGCAALGVWTHRRRFRPKDDRANVDAEAPGDES